MQNGKHLQQNKQAYIYIFLPSLAVGWNYLIDLYLLIGLKKKKVYFVSCSQPSQMYIVLATESFHSFC